jgi:hypothetical protein
LAVQILLLFPECEVFLEEFNDGLRISELIFGEVIDVFESSLEALISQLAGLLMILHDFIVED